MSKKKFWMIVKMIIVALVALYIITVFRKIFILKKIYNETDMNISKDNYSMTITMINEDGSEGKKTQSYYRDGRGKQIASNGVYTWTNQKYYFMIDENKKEISELNTEEYTDSVGIITNATFATFIPGYFKTFGERVKMVLNPSTRIKTEQVDNEKCYKITVKESSDGYKNTKKFWISKRDYTIKQSEIAIISKKDGSSSNLKYKYSITFLGVTVKDTDFITVTDYTMVNRETGERTPAVDLFTTEE